MAEQIEHSGVVVSTQAGEVCVKITSHSACGGCAARQACGLSEVQEKIIQVHTSEAALYLPGDQVTVGVRRRAAGRAVLLAYVGALIVLLVLLVVAIKVLGWGEGYAALSAVAGVVVYYGCLWLFRRKIENSIQFTITKNY